MTSMSSRRAPPKRSRWRPKTWRRDCSRTQCCGRNAITAVLSSKSRRAKEPAVREPCHMIHAHARTAHPAAVFRQRGSPVPVGRGAGAAGGRSGRCAARGDHRRRQGHVLRAWRRSGAGVPLRRCLRRSLRARAAGPGRAGLDLARRPGRQRRRRAGPRQAVAGARPTRRRAAAARCPRRRRRHLAGGNPRRARQGHDGGAGRRPGWRGLARDVDRDRRADHRAARTCRART